MLVQPSQSPKLPATQVALVCISIPRSLRGDGLDAVVAGHGDHSIGDDVVTVKPLNGCVD